MKQLEPLIALKAGITATEDVTGWWEPRRNGGVVIEGYDEQERPFRISLRYEELKKLVEWLEQWVKVREEQIAEMQKERRA